MTPHLCQSWIRHFSSFHRTIGGYSHKLLDASAIRHGRSQISRAANRLVISTSIASTISSCGLSIFFEQNSHALVARVGIPAIASSAMQSSKTVVVLHQEESCCWHARDGRPEWQEPFMCGCCLPVHTWRPILLC